MTVAAKVTALVGGLKADRHLLLTVSMKRPAIAMTVAGLKARQPPPPAEPCWTFYCGYGALSWLNMPDSGGALGIPWSRLNIPDLGGVCAFVVAWGALNIPFGA